MKGEKKGSPYRTLVKISILLAVLTLVCWVAVEAIHFYTKNALDQKVSEVTEANKKLETDYLLAKSEYESLTRTGQSRSWPEVPQEGVCFLDLSTYPLENATNQTVTRAALFEGGMILVNHWHPLPADFEIATANIKSVREWTSSRVPISSNAVHLYQAPALAIDEMIRDAKLEGFEHYIAQSAYRDNETQQKLFDDKIASIQRNNTKITGDALIAEALKTVNQPGTSEYQSGLAAEIKLYNKDDAAMTSATFQTTPQGIWFTENCWKYGLVFRFPTAGFPNAQTVDKTYKTGVSAKLNCYRYVGVAHSTAMRILGNLCLEEYIEYLIETPHFAIFDNGKLKYEIFRQPYEGGDAVVQVPQAATRFVSSMDNMGGVITAFYYE
jgi:D-alanyl-D-alanine carboxypeptidase